MTATTRQRCPALTVVAENGPDDVKLLTRIADWCDRFTPHVALDGPRGLLLDVTGAAHLFGGEQALLNRIRESLKAQGFAVRGAMAGTARAQATPFAAWLRETTHTASGTATRVNALNSTRVSRPSTSG